MLETVIKRDGRTVAFDEKFIYNAILSAFVSGGHIAEGQENTEVLEKIDELTNQVVENLDDDGYTEEVTVDAIQEYVMEVLLNSEYKDVAKAYIKYAERKAVERENVALLSKDYVATLTVVKKSGRLEPFDKQKLYAAITSASKNIAKGDLEKVVNIVSSKVFANYDYNVTTEQLHDLVEDVLTQELPEVYQQYAIYRRCKKMMSKAFDSARQDAERILLQGDKENANKDSQLNSTKQTLVAEAFMKQLVKDFELPKEIRMLHEQGWLYVHDISARYLRQANCCLFDISSLLKDGFYMNSVKYFEPKYIDSALSVVGDVTLQASAQQFGGFTLPELDTVLAPYLERTYQHYLGKYKEYFGEFTPEVLIEQKAYESTVRDLEQGMQGFETKLNTVSSSLGQVPFVTVTFGLNTSKWGREVSKAILKTRKAGMGQERVTAVFPKLVFLAKEGVNQLPDDTNYDIFKLAIDCSQTRLYPDYLSLDGEHNNIAEVYRRSGQVVSPMGCRAFLSPFFQGDKEIYTGRGNLGAVTLNLPMIALESNGDKDKFFATIRDLASIIWNYHEDYAIKVGKQKASTNPLFYCEGGAWQKLDYDQEIASTIAAFTSSLGYIGVHEAVVALTGDTSGIVAHKELAVEIVEFLKKMLELGKQTLKHTMPALYSTPAESLCYTFAKLNKNKYGLIEGVTDREYLTNSFHVPVWQEIDAPEKIAFEQPFHAIATGGRISYNEYPYNTNVGILEEAIRFAMQNGEYYGVNIVSTQCLDCSFSGDYRDVCPKCLSSEIRVVSRVCGYLSLEKVGKMDSGRYNPGKQAEILERVKHF